MGDSPTDGNERECNVTDQGYTQRRASYSRNVCELADMTGLRLWMTSIDLSELRRSRAFPGGDEGKDFRNLW